MKTKWDQTELQRHIDDGVEESLTLDYKAAGALEKDDEKKREITKDVSAIANSAGGVIIYGIKEHSAKSKKHLPEKFTPIDRTQFSREWLEQIINSIQPRIIGIKIHPVSLATDPKHVAYVVEIPQSKTVHQARDFRYYKRFNFESVPMNDYEVKDVMNRATLPDVDVKFTNTESFSSGLDPEYRLNIALSNRGEQVVKRYMLIFTFPNFKDQMTLRQMPFSGDPDYEFYGYTQNSAGTEYTIMIRSKHVLFPQQRINIGSGLGLTYKINFELHQELKEKKNAGNEIIVAWNLYADAMPMKRGKIPFSSLYDSNK